MRRTDAGGAQLLADLVEVGQLRLRLRRSVVRRRGEVGHQPFQSGVMRIVQGRQNLRRAGARSQSSHAGIDLQVVVDSLARRGGQAVHIADLPQRVDCRREIEFH